MKWKEKFRFSALAGLLAASLSVLMLAAPVDATHYKKNVDHGWVFCSGIEAPYAIAYGKGWVKAEIHSEAFGWGNSGGWIRVFSGYGQGHGQWSATGSPINERLSFGSCG